VRLDQALPRFELRTCEVSDDIGHHRADPGVVQEGVPRRGDRLKPLHTRQSVAHNDRVRRRDEQADAMFRWKSRWENVFSAASLTSASSGCTSASKPREPVAGSMAAMVHGISPMLAPSRSLREQLGRGHANRARPAATQGGGAGKSNDV